MFARRSSEFTILKRNEGHVCVATSSDTPALAVDAIADWWRLHRPDYPQAKRLMIEADSGGEQRGSVAVFQEGTPKPRKRNRVGNHRLPLPAGNVEVESHRNIASSARSQQLGLGMC